MAHDDLAKLVDAMLEMFRFPAGWQAILEAIEMTRSLNGVWIEGFGKFHPEDVEAVQGMVNRWSGW